MAIVMRVQNRMILFNLRVILVSLFILNSGLGISTSWAFSFESEVSQSPLSLVKKDLRAQFVALAEKNKLRASEVSFSLIVPGYGTVSHRSEESRTPASTMKLLVAAAAMDLLGPDHNFVTRLLGSGDIREGVLFGNLIVEGRGDPAVCGREKSGDPLWELRSWVASLRDLGISSIDGKILADDRYLAGSGIHPDWPTNELARWYYAPSGSLNLNDNCLDVQIGPVVNGKVAVSILPSQPLAQLSNKLKICVDPKKHLYHIARPGSSWSISVSGRFLATAGARTEYVSVPDPAENFSTIFTQLLQDSGIKVLGNDYPISADLTPSEDLMHIDEVNHSLASRLPVMLKNSQNLYAESMFRVLGRESGGTGDHASSQIILQNWVAENIPGEFAVVCRDGSGLSKKNRLTTDFLVKLLGWVDQQHWSEVFFSALPVSGIDGTLEKRMTAKSLRGKVYAKTGTLKNASGLAGYLKADQQDESVVFAFLYDGRPGIVYRARKWQDACLSLIQK